MKLKGVLLAYVLALWLPCFCEAQSKSDTLDYPFKLGEKLEYSMNYGWFEVGTAEVEIDSEWWKIDGRPHYYVQSRVTTTGFFSFFTKLTVCMDSWIDAETLLPVQSSRDFSFGKKIDIRTDCFSYQDSVRVSSYVEDVDSHRFHVFPNAEVPVLDVLGAYLFLRHSISENRIGVNAFSVGTFFSNDLYPFSMIESSIAKITLNDRQYMAQRYELIFPKTDEFPSEKETYVLTTMDSLLIPLKFSLEMKYGDFSFELKNHYRP